jgi:hypothetical protein
MQGSIDTETGDLILTVDAQGLDQLVELLRHAKSMSVPLRPAQEYAFTRPISALRLELNMDDAIVIATSDDGATISASPESFARLAQGIRQFGEYNDLSEPGMHTHFDPGERSAADGAVLAASSRSLIVAGPVSDEAAPDA